MASLNLSLSQVATAAALAGFGISYYLSSCSSSSSRPLVPCSFEVESKHVAFLKEMQEKFKVKDISKAVRIAVQFAMNEQGEQKKIYEEKICNTCGGKKNKTTISIELHESQKKFLETATVQYKVKDVNKALRCILEYSETKGDRDTIFGKVRCSSC